MKQQVPRAEHAYKKTGASLQKLTPPPAAARAARVARAPRGVRSKSTRFSINRTIRGCMGVAYLD